MRTILEIARQEFTINVRNKWTVLFAVVFGLLVVSISYFGIAAEGYSGLQSFTRTSASILNLVLYIVPLISLTMGTLSFTGDKGSTELLYSQPVSRGEVLFGKLLGIFWSIAVSTLSGFVVAGTIILFNTGLDGLARYASFVALSLGLALVFLSVSVAVSIACKRKSKAFGLSLFIWFFFVLFYDLLAIGGAVLLSWSSANVFLFLSLFGNPVDMVRVASLIILDDVTIFGAAGAALLRFLGGPVLSLSFLAGGLGLWIAVPLLASHRMLRRQDL